jgi:hypothetical protein
MHISINFLVEELCSDEKEKNMKALLVFSSNLEFHGTQTWKLVEHIDADYSSNILLIV